MQKKSKKFLELCALRQRLELVQSDLAKIVGCSESNYGAKERGDVHFTLDECLAIKNAVNKKLEKLGKNTVTLEDIFLR